jgi:coenzyme F420 biosynthesis associated uncharacterized protein
MQHVPLIDWDAAVSAGTMVLPAGPILEAGKVEEVVAALRRAAAAATAHVADVTELPQPASSEILVVDRATWLKAVTRSASAMLAAAAGAPEPATSSWQSAKAKALGGQVGVVMAVVATRILGQFDPFGEPNRLMLVAPNVVTVERALGVVPDDFRLWVCLHEETHRFQFGYAPWLRTHLLGLIGELLDGDDLGFAWRSDDAGAVLGSPAQQDAFDKASAVMSLLEGHADVMMDRVGPEVVPSFAAIRRAFDQRRYSSGWFSWVQKLLGLDLKYAQYREGGQFCREVIEAADVATLNRAFTAPELLPSLDELREPQRWLDRISAL